MELYLIRHGIAEDYSAQGSDAERALTEEGVLKLRQAVQGLTTLGVEFERILTSPLLRARQTAALLEPLGDAPAIPTEHLACPPAQPLLSELERLEQGGTGRIALVGHQPWLGQLIGWLISGEPALGAGVRVRKGNLAWLRGRPQPGGMQLEVLLKPDWLRRF